MKKLLQDPLVAHQDINPSLKLSDLTDSFFCLPKNLDRSIVGISTDSRKIKPGYLFVACPGEGDKDGRDYIQDALINGAVAIFSESSSSNKSSTNLLMSANSSVSSVPHVQIPDLSSKVGLICSTYHQNPSLQMQMIGVTGTNGKTTVATLLAKCLNNLDIKSGFVGTQGYGSDLKNLKNSTLTTPFPLELQSILSEMRYDACESVCMEVSSHAISQKRIAGICYDTLVLTNVSQDHLDYHKTVDEYYSVKESLFYDYGARNLVINIDDQVGRKVCQNYKGSGNIYGYKVSNRSFADMDNVIVGHQIESSLDGLSLYVTYKKNTCKVNTKLVGSFNVSNILAVVATLLSMDFSLSEIAEAISKVDPVSGRMEVVSRKNSPLIVIDYAHTPAALESVLNSLQSYCDKKLVCVFGCGGQRDTGKRKLMGKIAEKYCDHVILTNDNPRLESQEKIVGEILQGVLCPWAFEIIYDRTEAIIQAMSIITKGDVLLIAGKGHESIQIVGDEKVPFNDKEKVEFLLSLKEGL